MIEIFNTGRQSSFWYFNVVQCYGNLDRSNCNILTICCTLQLPPIALLTGPAGVGKTATIKVLAKELKCDIKEWINPIATDYNKDFQNMSGRESVYIYVNQKVLCQS